MSPSALVKAQVQEADLLSWSLEPAAAPGDVGPPEEACSELGTIGTFLADVEDDKAVQTAKVEFVNRMFGRAWEDHRSPKGESAEVLDISTLGRVLDAARKLQGSN